MKKYFTYLLCAALASNFFVACTKYANQSTSDNNNNNNNTTKTDTAPNIKFYSAMDGNIFGSVDVSLNGKKVTTTSRYYPSAYFVGKEGTNTVSLNFTGKSDVLLNANVDLVRNANYTCFFYKIGNDWKWNLVRDDLSKKPADGYALVRILDFRTEAYFNYINVSMSSSSTSGYFFSQQNRNFLDHVTYSGYTYFRDIYSGSYDIFLYRNVTTQAGTTAETTSKRTGVTIDNKGIYTVVLTTPGNITPYTNAIYSIFPDLIKHN